MHHFFWLPALPLRHSRGHLARREMHTNRLPARQRGYLCRQFRNRDKPSTCPGRGVYLLLSTKFLIFHSALARRLPTIRPFFAQPVVLQCTVNSSGTTLRRPQPDNPHGLFSRTNKSSCQHLQCPCKGRPAVPRQCTRFEQPAPAPASFYYIIGIFLAGGYLRSKWQNRHTLQRLVNQADGFGHLAHTQPNRTISLPWANGASPTNLTFSIRVPCMGQIALKW